MPFNDELFSRVTNPVMDATSKENMQRIAALTEKFRLMREAVNQSVDGTEFELYQTWQGLMVQLFVEEALLMSLAMKKVVDCERDAHESALMDISLLASLSATMLDRYQEKEVMMEMISNEIVDMLRGNAELNAAGRA